MAEPPGTLLLRAVLLSICCLCYLNLEAKRSLKMIIILIHNTSLCGGEYPPGIMCVQYHEYIGEISWVHRGDIMIHLGEQVDKSLWFILKTPMYWTSPDILPHASWYPPNVLNIPRCTHVISPPPPPPPNVLNTHYTGWDHGRFDFNAVFTMIRCSANFCVCKDMKLIQILAANSLSEPSHLILKPYRLK